MFKTKSEVISFFGTQVNLANFLGIARESIWKWPEELPQRIVNEIAGAILTNPNTNIYVSLSAEIQTNKKQNKKRLDFFHIMGALRVGMLESDHDRFPYIQHLSIQHGSDMKVSIIKDTVSSKDTYLFEEPLPIYDSSKFVERNIGAYVETLDERKGGVGEGKTKLPKLTRKVLVECTLLEYLETCKTENRKPIPADHAVFVYAKKIELPDEFLSLAWRFFKDKYTTAERQKVKKYKDWSLVFLNAIRDNWLKLWFINREQKFELTTIGLQAKRELLHNDEDMR